MGAGAGILRKGADWGNAHGREPRLGQVFVVVSNTLSEGSFFSSLFKQLQRTGHPRSCFRAEAPATAPGRLSGCPGA